MSMPTSIELIQAMNVIGVWFFWFVVYLIITLAILALGYATILFLSQANNKSARGFNYGKSRRINKRVA